MTAPRQTSHAIDPLFTRRWSARAFTGEAVSPEQLMSILEAARWAPSAYNAQPWRFVYAHRDTAAWQPLFDCLAPGNQAWVAKAGALVIVASAKEAMFPGKDALSANAWHAFDTGAAWVSMAFQASLSGLVAHAMAGFDPDRLRVAIGLPEAYALHAVVAIGKQGDKSGLPEALQAREAPNGRTELAKLVSEGRFAV